MSIIGVSAYPTKLLSNYVLFCDYVHKEDNATLGHPTLIESLAVGSSISHYLTGDLNCHFFATQPAIWMVNGMDTILFILIFFFALQCSVAHQTQ